MKIERLSIENFQVHRNFSAALDDMNLICGFNDTGKTCIQDAIAFAFGTYRMRGIKHKKDLASLITDGARKGTVALDFDSGESVVRDVGTGKGDDQSIERIDPNGIMRFITDMHAFSALSESERRTFLFRLMGIEADPQAICERLKNQGFNAMMVESIKPLLRSGFSAAANEARGKAREHKALWREITGETYGPEKAEKWKPDIVLASIEDAREKAKALLAEGNNEQEKLNALLQALGKHDRIEEERKVLQKRIEELEPVAVMLEDREEQHRKFSTELLVSEEALEEAKKKADELSKQLSHAPAGKNQTVHYESWKGWHRKCPACGVSLTLDAESDLVRYAQDDRAIRAGLAEAHKKIKSLQMKVTDMRNKSAIALKEIKYSIAAQSSVREFRLALRNLPELIAVDKEMISEAKEKVAAFRAQSDEVQAKIKESLKVDEDQGKALAHHHNAQAYLDIAAALSPDGLQKQMLQEVMGPINSTLEKHSRKARFPLVRIDDDMDILVGGRRYEQRAESVQWRADAILAVSFAEISGLGFVVLDRLDVLDIPSRGKALSWLYNIKEQVQSIVMATLKQAPPDREGLSVIWLEGEAR